MSWAGYKISIMIIIFRSSIHMEKSRIFITHIYRLKLILKIFNIGFTDNFARITYSRCFFLKAFFPFISFTIPGSIINTFCFFISIASSRILATVFTIKLTFLFIYSSTTSRTTHINIILLFENRHKSAPLLIIIILLQSKNRNKLKQWNFQQLLTNLKKHQITLRKAVIQFHLL